MEAERRSTITSVGIDIGTSTTQVVFARLTMENTAGYFSIPHIVFVDKEIFYRSPIDFTPLLDVLGEATLDGDGIRRIVMREYGRAGIKPQDVASGAVIITGESARKSNSKIVTQSLAGLAGDFVVSTAGPDIEAVIAGKGSGAARVSDERGITVANLDIGGGTTNIAIFRDGEVTATGCFDVGGRLVRVEAGRICYVSESAATIARDAGIEIRPGDAADEKKLSRVCERMAALLDEALGFRQASKLLEQVRTRGSAELVNTARIDAVCFSGGVADCISAETPREQLRFGDIGPLLGSAVARSALCRDVERISARETIRATVVGAGTYTTTISGSTILQRADLLPMKNLPALKLSASEAERCCEGDVDFLSGRIAWFVEQSDAEQIVLAMDGDDDPSYECLKTLASCIADAWARALPPGTPVILAVRSDTAKALGQTIEFVCGGDPPAHPIVCIDDVFVENGDYIDIGRPMMDGMVVPVVVKTLAFG